MNRVVAEVRVSVTDQEAPPFSLGLVFLLDDVSLTQGDSEALDAAVDAIRGAVDANQGDLADQVRMLNRDTMSAREVEHTREVFLEDLTYRGEEVTGAEPVG